MAVLVVENVSKSFGGVKALDNVSLCINEKEIVGLIGPNGAGKTTFINIITGSYTPDSGEIFFKGKNITKLRPDLRCQMGIARTYQIPRLFWGLTVLENVLISILNSGRHGKISVTEAKVIAAEMLKGFGLEKLKDAEARLLNAPQRRMLEFARALGANPELLLLDECVTGLTPSEVMEILKIVKRIADEKNVCILMVEHILYAVMNVSDRIIVFHEGRKIAEGKPEKIASDEKVAEIYFGDREIALGFQEGN